MVTRGDLWEGGIVREFKMDMYTLLYLKRKTNKDLLDSTENTAQCYVPAWMGEEPGGEGIRVYVPESPCCVPGTTTCLTGCTAAAAKWLQPCLTLCGPTDGSPPGSPIPGILQARTLEWAAISFSNAEK